MGTRAAYAAIPKVYSHVRFVLSGLPHRVDSVTDSQPKRSATPLVTVVLAAVRVYGSRELRMLGDLKYTMTGQLDYVRSSVFVDALPQTA